MMDRVCLLGASGFLGRSIGAKLEEMGVDWIGLTRREYNNPRWRPIALDKTRDLAQIISDYPIVINALGSLKPRDFLNDLQVALDSFWESKVQLEKILRTCPVAKFVHVSSAGTVYGEAEERSNIESDLLNPKSWYGRIKVIEEQAFAQQTMESNIPYVCARVSNPFGNTDVANHGFIDVLANCVQEKKPFKAFISKDACRDFIYAPAMAEMITTLAFSKSVGVYNVGCGESLNLTAILDFVESTYPNASITREYIKNDWDVVRCAISTEKYDKEFGRTPAREVTVFEYIKLVLRRNIQQSTRELNR